MLLTQTAVYCQHAETIRNPHLSASNPDSFGDLYLVWKTRPAMSYESNNMSPAASSIDLEYLLATTSSSAPLHPSFPQCIQCGPCYRRLLPQSHSVGRVRSVARCKSVAFVIQSDQCKHANSCISTWQSPLRYYVPRSALTNCSQARLICHRRKRQRRVTPTCSHAPTPE